MKFQIHRNILEFTLSSLLRRKGKNLSIIVTYALMVFLLGSVIFIVSGIKGEAELVLEESPDIVVQLIKAGRHDLIPVALKDQVKEIRGVTRVVPRVWGYYFDTPTQSNYTILGVNNGMNTGILKEISQSVNLSKDGPLDDREVLIGEGVSKARELKNGNLFSLARPNTKLKTFKVAGVFKSDSSLLTHDLIVMSDEAVRDLFLFPQDYATDLAVYVRNKSEIETIGRKMGEVIPGTRAVIKEQIMKSYETVFGWRSGLVFTALLGTLLAFAILSWDKATGLSAEEKREIGILKALGWETNDILEMKFWEGMVISLTSFLIGIILAYLHIFIMGSFLLVPAIVGWSVLYPPFNLTPYLDIGQIFLILFITVVPYTAATIIPTWKASTIDPDEVIRGI